MENLNRALANWPALSRLLDEALDLAPHERSAWIAALPPEHDALKPDLERMLGRARGGSADGFTGVLPAVADIHAGDPCHPGDVVGPWRLLRNIGEGGMASVWEAERHDGLFDRRVAIKLPRRDWPSGALSERIARERKILARMNHPNIARLLDAGTTSAGQPYLALEYVDGERIDHHCRDHKPPLRKRLELFLQVARAIAYAHSMLVLHRDLKPSNILVTGSGEVRVLDFGIAKILDPAQTRETALTRISGPVLTLEYASPEQILQEPLTVASDIYSLGVVLYELLTGVRPYNPRNQSRAALEEAILDADPRPSSEAAIEPAMQKALRGELDTILLKAQKKQPTDRYASVERMAEDIERYLDNRPVLARPDRISYRVAKFVRRNLITIVIGGFLALLLFAGGAAILLQARASAVQKQQIAAVRRFVVPILLEAHGYNGGMQPHSALQLLQEVEQRIDQMQNADPETLVEVMNIAAASLFTLQETARSETVVKKAVRAASALDPGHAQSLRARLLRNWVRLSRGETGDTRRDIGPLLAAMRKSSRTLPEDLAGALRIRSAVALAEGNSAEAESSALEALGFAEIRLGRLHNQVVLALVDLCYAYRLGGKLALAVSTGELARERALEAYSQRQTHPNVIKAREAHAFALAASGHADAGIQEMNGVIRDISSSFGVSSRAEGFALRRLASMQFDAGNAGNALESVNRAVSILSEHLNRDGPGFARTLELRGRILAAAQTRFVADRKAADFHQRLH